MLKIVLKNLWAVRAPSRTLLGSSLALPQTPLLPLSKNPTPLLAFGLDFWPFPDSLHFPQCIGVLIKTLVVPIFGAKECTRMQDFVLKCTKKFRGSRSPGPFSGRGDICSHPPPSPPARCWCPSASSRLATALVKLSCKRTALKRCTRTENLGNR